VLINLITNAYHAVESAGVEIRVRLRERRLETAGKNGGDPMLPPGDYMEITVSDTGVGMDAATREKVFDPFFTTKPQGKGTGLGLSVVHGIVKEHHGDIRLSGELGKGTEFRVLLPILPSSDLPPPQPVSIAGQTGTERILLVDDEESIVLLEKQMLERLGYRIDAWTLGEDALRTFRKGPEKFDLLITDMAMPGMTGEELAREVLAIRPDMPIILCTGFSDRMNREQARKIGIRGFLMKPAGQSDLARTVREVLDEGKTPAGGSFLSP
jgi:CheY-like chemotaxis protein